MLLRRRAQELVSLSEKRRWNCSTRRECPPVKLPSAAERRRAWRRSLGRWFLSVKSIRWFSSAFTAPLQMTSRNALKRAAGYGAAGGACGYFQVRIYPSAAKEQWGVLVRADSQLAEREFVTPEDLRGVPLLMVRRELVKTNWPTGLVIPLTSWKSRQHTT